MSPSPTHTAVVPTSGPSRLAYIDWMRGLACVLMFQTHCYDSWLGGQARLGRFFTYSQLGGTFPAPLFLFLAGISFALVTDRLWQKNLASAQIARTTIRRGAEIFALGFLLRLQEYILAWGWSPKSDLLRVDILNTIGVSMMLMGIECWIVLSLARPANLSSAAGALPRKVLAAAASATAVLISLLTPLLWTTWRPSWLPWPVESYIDGVHNLGTPQSWLFPIFPWTAFAFAGLAVGFALMNPRFHAHQIRIFFCLGAAGLLLIELSRWLDAMPFQLYPVYDYWHTSPEFFLIRLGMLLVILTASYAWCRWIIGKRIIAKMPRPWSFSPLIQLGQASLLVYWVHIEFVYGRFSILPKHRVGIAAASVGLLVITLAMLALAYVRTHPKGSIKDRIAEAFAGMHHAKGSS